MENWRLGYISCESGPKIVSIATEPTFLTPIIQNSQGFNHLHCATNSESNDAPWTSISPAEKLDQKSHIQNLR